MLKFATLLAILPAIVLASPVSFGQVGKRDTYIGQATYYEVGLGACGNTNSDSEAVLALDPATWNNGGHCGQNVTITSTDFGITATGKVVDFCPDCQTDSLNLSPSLFETLSNNNLGLGVIQITWSFL